jgi:hypothetical protein
MWGIYTTGMIPGILFGLLTATGSVATVFAGRLHSRHSDSIRPWVQLTLGALATIVAWGFVFGPLLAFVYAPMFENAGDARWAYLVCLMALGLLIAVRGYRAQPHFGGARWLRVALPLCYGVLTPAVFGLMIPWLHG